MMDWIDYREKLGIGFCDEEKYKLFKQKILNVLNSLVEDDCSGCLERKEYFDFCNMTGTSLKTHYNESYHNKERLEHCVSIIEHTTSLEELLAYYIALVNSVKTNKVLGNYWTRIKFANLLRNMLTQAHIPFDLLEYNEEYFIFPKGVKEMDDALVSEPLHWLTNYPKAEKAYVNALKDYANADSDNASRIADSFRKTLETFFQEFFGGNAALENYKKQYGDYLKSHGVPKEISANFETLLQAYTNFMNNYAKHRDATSDTVLEYLKYQTGNIIRLLITLK